MPISPKCIAKKSVRSTTLADLYSKSTCIQINHKSILNTGAFEYSGKSKISLKYRLNFGNPISFGQMTKQKIAKWQNKFWPNGKILVA